MNLSSVISSTGLRLLFFAVQASSLTLLTSSQCFSNPAAEYTVDNSNFRRWIAEGEDETSLLASPIPQLLFSLPPTKFFTSTWNLSWLNSAELAPFQERLNPDSRLIDLTNQMAVLDPIFWELVTTDGLIIGITQRPKNPIPGDRIIYNINCKPRWESFWEKPLPVPSAIRATAFTRELLQEDDKLSWRAVSRVLNP